MGIFRPGRNSFGANTPGEQWLPIASTEIMTAYLEWNQFSDKMTTKPTMQGQNYARFPMFWKIGSEVHELGAELLGSEVEQAYREISVDARPLTASFYDDDIDRIFAQYDSRAPITTEMGLELARQVDKKDAKLIIKASRVTQVSGSSFYGGGIDGNGTAISDANLSADTDAGALALLAAIDRAVVRWDTIDMPDTTPRWCAIRPALFHRLRNLGSLVTGVSAGALPLLGHGDIDSKNPQITEQMARTQYLQYKGVNIFRSTHLPTTNDTTSDSKYSGDYTKTQGVIFTSDAAAKVVAMGVTTETERKATKGLTFMVAKTLTGGGTNRPEASIELVVP